MATASNARQADKDRDYLYNHAPAGPPMTGQPGYVPPAGSDSQASTPMNRKTTEATSTTDDGTTVTRSRQRCHPSGNGIPGQEACAFRPM